MRISRPSPSMVVAIIALVVASAGTATAASLVLIKNSSQVRAGSLTGSDLKAGSLTSRNLKAGSVTSKALRAGAVNGAALRKGSVGTDQLSTSVKSALTSQGFTATEAVRKEGPSAANGGEAVIAKLTGLAPGTYSIIAKTVITPVQVSGGLVGELLKPEKTITIRCILDGAGDNDDAVVPIGTPFSLYSNTAQMQFTRTLSAAADIVLKCNTPQPWKAANTSIIALKLSGSSRVDSTG